MESAKEPLKIVYVVYTKVNEVKELNDLFYVHFDGSRESIAFPVPAFQKDDKVKITFAKVDHDNSGRSNSEVQAPNNG